MSPSSSSDGAVVRHARRQDVPDILTLIRALAAYEKESNAVEATPDSLLATLAFAPDADEAASDSLDASSSSSSTTTAAAAEPLSPTRPARCLLLFPPEGGPAVGMALYFYNYSTWRARHGIHLEDLFVQPAVRGRGYGRRLLVELARQVVAGAGGRLEWSVLKWNEPSIRFYRGLGAVTMDDWVGMRVDGAALEKLARLLD